MSPCICVDDTNGMFRVITGTNYRNIITIKRPQKGDKVFFEITKTGVHISLTDNKDSSFMFMTEYNFHKHFQELSIKRDNSINQLLD